MTGQTRFLGLALVGALALACSPASAAKKKTDASAATPAAAAPAAPGAATAPAAASSKMTSTKAATAPSMTEAQASAKCPTGVVVWINPKSKVYHFKGTKDYGTTKRGTYACEADAMAAGDKAAKNEKHP